MAHERAKVIYENSCLFDWGINHKNWMIEWACQFYPRLKALIILPHMIVCGSSSFDLIQRCLDCLFQVNLSNGVVDDASGAGLSSPSALVLVQPTPILVLFHYENRSASHVRVKI